MEVPVKLKQGLFAVSAAWAAFALFEGPVFSVSMKHNPIMTPEELGKGKSAKPGFERVIGHPLQAVKVIGSIHIALVPAEP